ncbi:MAG: hypothetical protein RLZZ460_657 [Chloroflexota bacterium]|jgi:hypothetical protein
METLGYTVAIVERWNPFAKIRQDLFGVLDLLCLGQNEVVGVQTTSGANVSARVRKIAEHENTPRIRKAGIRILVHGWRKNSAGKYVLREVDVS